MNFPLDVTTSHIIFSKVAGIAVTIGFALALSSYKTRIKWLNVFVMMLAQFGIAALMLKTAAGIVVGDAVSHVFTSLYACADVGSRMVFGNLVDPAGLGGWGFIFAIKVTALITFMGGLIGLLAHIGVINIFVRGIAAVTTPLFGVSGAEGLCAVANSVLGQIESPMLVKTYLNRMTRAELMTVMISGFATTSVTLLVTFAAQGISALHLFTSSVMSIPGAMLMAKIIEPETGTPETLHGSVNLTNEESQNVLDALSTGALHGFKISGIIVAMLLVFISSLTLLDSILSNVVFMVAGIKGVTFDFLLSKIFSGIPRLLNIDPAERETVAALVGNRMMINEFVAFLKMATFNLSEYSKTMLVYLLCGFANFSSIGMQVGAISVSAPDRRSTLNEIGLRAMIGGTLVNILNAFIVSLVI